MNLAYHSPNNTFRRRTVCKIVKIVNRTFHHFKSDHSIFCHNSIIGITKVSTQTATDSETSGFHSARNSKELNVINKDIFGFGRRSRTLHLFRTLFHEFENTVIAVTVSYKAKYTDFGINITHRFTGSQRHITYYSILFSIGRQEFFKYSRLKGIRFNSFQFSKRQLNRSKSAVFKCTSFDCFQTACGNINRSKVRGIHKRFSTDHFNACRNYNNGNRRIVLESSCFNCDNGKSLNFSRNYNLEQVVSVINCRGFVKSCNRNAVCTFFVGISAVCVLEYDVDILIASNFASVYCAIIFTELRFGKNNIFIVFPKTNSGQHLLTSQCRLIALDSRYTFYNCFTRNAVSRTDDNGNLSFISNRTYENNFICVSKSAVGVRFHLTVYIAANNIGRRVGRISRRINKDSFKALKVVNNHRSRISHRIFYAVQQTSISARNVIRILIGRSIIVNANPR